MEYFVIKSHAVMVPQPAQISNRDYPYQMTEENFQKIDDAKVDYYHLNQDTEVSEVLLQPTFMCGDELKHIMEVYDSTIKWKSVYLIPSLKEQLVDGTLHYWIPSMTRQKCLHQDCVTLPNGALEKLVLNQRLVRNMDVFQVADTLENYVIVSLPLAESISRRHMYGVALERVEVR